MSEGGGGEPTAAAANTGPDPGSSAHRGAPSRSVAASGPDAWLPGWLVRNPLHSGWATVQSLAGDSERAVASLGFNLLAAAVPLVISVLWMAFIVRCAWFLRRLRGWRQSPANSRVPKKFLCGRPELRRVVVGLAHPGLMLVAGLGTSVLALFLGAVELTLNVLQ